MFNPLWVNLFTKFINKAEYEVQFSSFRSIQSGYLRCYERKIENKVLWHDYFRWTGMTIFLGQSVPSQCCDFKSFNLTSLLRIDVSRLQVAHAPDAIFVDLRHPVEWICKMKLNNLPCCDKLVLIRTMKKKCSLCPTVPDYKCPVDWSRAVWARPVFVPVLFVPDWYHPSFGSGLTLHCE